MNSFNPILIKIQELLFCLASKAKSVSFCWVPSHVGIYGNEVADKEAKKAVLEKEIGYKKVPYSDMKIVIKQYIRNVWQERWASPSLLNNIKYKKIRPNTLPWSSSNNSIRGYETRLSRLRIGHTLLTHRFIFEQSDPPVCDFCQAVLTVEHILVDCQFYHRT